MATALFDANTAGEIRQRIAIQGGRDDELLVVFPRLYVVEKNHVPEPVNAGTVLRRSQTLAAAQELEEQPVSPTFGRATSTRCRPQKPRNLPISVHGKRSSGAQAFLEQKFLMAHNGSHAARSSIKSCQGHRPQSCSTRLAGEER